MRHNVNEERERQTRLFRARRMSLLSVRRQKAAETQVSLASAAEATRAAGRAEQASALALAHAESLASAKKHAREREVELAAQIASTHAAEHAAVAEASLRVAIELDAQRSMARAELDATRAAAAENQASLERRLAAAARGEAVLEGRVQRDKEQQVVLADALAVARASHAEECGAAEARVTELRAEHAEACAAHSVEEKRLGSGAASMAVRAASHAAALGDAMRELRAYSAAMRVARSAGEEAAGAAMAQLGEQRAFDDAHAAMLSAHALAMDGAAAELESVWAAALAASIAAEAERAARTAGSSAASVAACTAALASAAAGVAALAARHSVEAATSEVLDARALEKALGHALAEKAELMMRIAEGRPLSPRGRGASAVTPLCHVGYCDKEGSLLKQSDWLRQRHTRYFYVYGRALIYYHNQPKSAAATLVQAGEGARLVADRPPDGCFILASPPFEAGYDAASFNLCVACVGRQAPLVLFAASAADKTAWIEALGKTFFEHASYGCGTGARS